MGHWEAWEHTQNDGRDRRLLHLLVAALQLGLGLAATGILLLGELGVPAPLLRCLGLEKKGVVLA